MNPETAEVTQDIPEPRRFVICGNDSLAYRLADELANRHNGEVTVIVPSRTEGYSPRIAKLARVSLIEAGEPDGDAFAAADLGTAEALGLVGRDDIANIDAALRAHEANPRIRIVVRMFNPALGEGLDELPYCTVLSDTAMAAPAFVAAAHGETPNSVRVRNGTLLVSRRSQVRPADILCGLAITEGRDHPQLIPADQDSADLVLTRVRENGGHRHRRRRRLTHHYPLREVMGRVWVRVRIVLGLYACLLLAGASVIAWNRPDRNGWQAAYSVLVVAFGGVGIDFSLTTVEQVVQTVLSFSSLALIPLLTATIVDAVVKSRLEISEGSLTKRASGHVVVAGLGGIGSTVLQALYDHGVDVVAVDRSPDSRGGQLARELHVPLVIGDSANKETLKAASVQTCGTLMALTPDDATNLETALMSRGLRAGLPVVLRLFDGDFAYRIQQAFDIPVSRSVSYLAAPAFAGQMLGHVLDTLAVGRHVLVVAELTVEPYAPLEGQTVGSLRRPQEAWLLGLTNPQGQQLPPSVPAGRRINRGERLLVVATRGGLARLLAETTSPDHGLRAPIVLHDTHPYSPPAAREPEP